MSKIYFINLLISFYNIIAVNLIEEMFPQI